MYNAGKIIYFDPFYFKNGNTSKPKYFIVLNNDGNNTILASLPTRSDNVPSNVEVKHGCINIESACFNCYFFEKNRPIATNGWAFGMNTFLYGANIEDYDLIKLNEVFVIEGIDFHVMGTLKKDEFNSLIECFKNSSSVRKKFKNKLKKL